MHVGNCLKSPEMMKSQLIWKSGILPILSQFLATQVLKCQKLTKHPEMDAQPHINTGRARLIRTRLIRSST